MATEEEKKQRAPQCKLIAILVVVLLLILGFMVMRDNKSGSKMSGGKWKARGGCGCLPPK